MSLRGAIRELFGRAPPLSEPYPDQPPDRVVSYETSNLWHAINNGERYNPDDLVAQKGLLIYSKMLNDEQVKSVTEFKLNAILGRGWQFKFDGSTKLSPEEQKRRIQVFNAITRKIRGSFVDSIEGIASGREYGFSVTEKVYGQIQHDGATFTGINMLLTRDPCSFRFFVDEHGLLDRITQRVNGKPEIDIDRNRIVHYVHKPKWDLVYGRSELRSAYRAWYLKDITLKLWALHLEKFGSGIPVATLGDEAPTGEGFSRLQSVMNNFKALTSIILPKGVTAEVVFPQSTDQYEKALQYHDLAIAKSQLVPNLLGLSHTGQTGAYSQAQTQFEAFFWTTSSDGKRISECLNEQLFRDLGDQNWGDGEYPSFCFKPVSMEHAKWLLETWKSLLGAKAVQATEEDERFLRDLLEMPERDESTELLVDPMAERKMAIEEEAAKRTLPQPDQRFERIESELTDIRARLASPVNVTVHNPAPAQLANPTSGNLPAQADAAGAAVVPHGTLRGSTVEQFSRAAQRVAFAVIEKRTDDFATVAVDTLATIVAKATRRALGDDANLATLTDEDPSDVAALDLHSADRGKLKSAFRDLLVQAWSFGSDTASNELERARGERMSFAARRAHFVSLRDNASAYFETQSFRMAGDTSDQTRKLIQQELQSGIKFGKTLPEIRVAIWERLVSKGLTSLKAVKGVEQSDAIITALEALLIDNLDDVAPYLSTLVRTNTFEALNEARFAEFTDPAVSDFVQALEYAAVLDSSTTEICSHLGTSGKNGGGVIYRADSEFWSMYRPPNHFNCRSVLIPVTVIDGWDGEESAAPSVEPAVGFK